jgi:competence protein ComEC
MSSPIRPDGSRNFTPATGGDLAVFPVEGDSSPSADRPPAIRPGPLVPLTAAFLLGVLLAPACPVGSVGWAAAALLGLLLGVLGSWRHAPRLARTGLLAGFLCLGAQAMVAADRELPSNHLSRLPEAALGAAIAVDGWVAVPPDPRPPDTRDTPDTPRTRFVVEATHLTIDGRRIPATGRARLTVLGPLGPLQYGDGVRGSFRLRHPRRFDNPGAFDYPAYLASQGIFLEGWTREPVEVSPEAHGLSVLAWVFEVRRLLLERLDAALSPPQAGLLKAMVLGDRSGLTPEMHRAFLDSGTYHILAISGLNVSLLAGSLFGLFRLIRLSPRLAAAASALLVTFYAALAGGSASVIRAAVMADVYLLAVVLDRRGDLLNSLALSALALVWWNPPVLHEVGFQLTYLATLGIVLVLPAYQRILAPRPRAVRWALESVTITLAATVATLPILASAFNRIASVGVLANLPIVPVSGLITSLGTAACAMFLAIPGGVAWLNAVNGWLVELLFRMAEWFAGWPWSSVRVYSPTPAMLVAYYAALALALWACLAGPGADGRRRLRRWAGWFALGCGLLLVGQVLWRLAPAPEEARVRLTFLDVGQGEAILVDAAGAGRMLVDAGGMFGEGFDVGERVIAPFLWHEWTGRVDVLVLTHPQSDHIGGAPSLLRMFDVGEVWTGSSPALSPTDVWIQEYLRRRRIPHRVVAAGDDPARWGHAMLEVLHPTRQGEREASGESKRAPRPNDWSVVLRIRLADQAVLLTGDLEGDGEGALLRSGAPVAAQVLKVPHHGSRRSSTEPFLRAVGPTDAVLSVGHRNPFRHPHPEVLSRYKALGVRVWRTDRHGAVTVEMRPGETRVWGRRGEPASVRGIE